MAAAVVVVGKILKLPLDLIILSVERVGLIQPSTAPMVQVVAVADQAGIRSLALNLQPVALAAAMAAAAAVAAIVAALAPSQQVRALAVLSSSPTRRQDRPALRPVPAPLPQSVSMAVMFALLGFASLRGRDRPKWRSAQRLALAQRPVLEIV